MHSVFLIFYVDNILIKKLFLGKINIYIYRKTIIIFYKILKYNNFKLK